MPQIPILRIPAPSGLTIAWGYDRSVRARVARLLASMNEL